MSKEAASVGIRMKAGSRMRRHAPRGLKSSDVTRIQLRHGHLHRMMQGWTFRRALNHAWRPEDVVGRIGPVTAAGSRRGALAMRWREWAGAVARAIIVFRPCPPIGRFGLTLRGHNC